MLCFNSIKTINGRHDAASRVVSQALRTGAQTPQPGSLAPQVEPLAPQVEPQAEAPAPQADPLTLPPVCSRHARAGLTV